MATGISFGEADVTLPDGTTYTKVAVSTRNNVMTLRDQHGDTLLERAGVSAVVRQSSKRWVVRFGPADEPVQVLRTNCNCGGQR